jgi:transposase
VQDVIGVYVNPPEHALVLSVDEKSQIQALDRTPPGLPMKRGRCGTMTHDYKRHGTTTLFAALNVLDGKVIGQCMSRHRHQEFIRFLNKINRETPAEREVHLIVDNYAMHKHPKVCTWLGRHQRFHFHFTPTSASWLNAVEGFFAKLTRRRLKRGVFTGIADLQPLPARHQRQPQPLRLDRRPRRHHRKGPPRDRSKVGFAAMVSSSWADHKCWCTQCMATRTAIPDVEIPLNQWLEEITKREAPTR